MYKYSDVIEEPNLWKQVTDKDSWGQPEDLVLFMKEYLEREISNFGYGDWFEVGDTIWKFCNNAFVLLGWADKQYGEQMDCFVPVLGCQSVLIGLMPYIRQHLYDAGKYALKQMSIDLPGAYELIDMDIYNSDPYEWSTDYLYDARGETQGRWFGVCKKARPYIPVEEWPAYERQWMPYKQFLETDYWAKRRDSTLLDYGFRCALCNYKDTSLWHEDGISLQVHHRTYDRRGHEYDRDLIPLCRNCHDWHHKRL